MNTKGLGARGALIRQRFTRKVKALRASGSQMTITDFARACSCSTDAARRHLVALDALDVVEKYGAI